MNTDTSERLDQTKFFLWMRIIGGAFFALMAPVEAWKDFHSFLWLQSLSMACFFAFWRIRLPGESRRVYLTNPRAIVTNLSALAFGAVAIWWLFHHLR